MIISRTPLRMSLVGGGTDMPAFYKRQKGAVISTAINKYIYININKKFDNGVRIAYSKTEEVGSIEQIEHPLVRSVLQYLQLSGGMEITTIADIPSTGTGLGSSSAFTVGLLHALNAFMGNYVSPEKLGFDACKVEIELCGEPIGKQDQYAAAYGGFNLIQFFPDDSVAVEPVICTSKTMKELQSNTLVFYTGISRSASAILMEQSELVAGNQDKYMVMSKMAQLAYELKAELEKNNPSALGEILHEGWLLKKSITKGISTPAIDYWYEKALKAGAIGGKILGAGAGGFLMLNAPESRHESIINALSELRNIKIEFEPIGSRIIFYNQ